MSNLDIEGTHLDLRFLDENGESTLADHLGPAGAVVYFMRTSTCPACLRHVAALTGMYDDLVAAGWGVVVVVPEGPQEAADVHRRRRTPLRIVAGRAEADAHHHAGLAARFGVQRSGVVVVDRDQRVVYAHAATVPVFALDTAELIAATGLTD
jgi:peroxiredoxin